METPDLRPLSFGELLDRIFTYYRRHFWLFVGIMALPQVCAIALNLLFLGFQRQNFGTATPQDPARTMTQLSAALTEMMISTGLVLLIYFVVYTVGLGATTCALSELHLGRSISIGGAYGKIRGKIWRLLDVVFSVMLRIVGAYLLVVVCAVLLGLIGGFVLAAVTRSKAAMDAGIVSIMGVGFLGSAVFAVMLILRYGVAVPALVLENLTARQALKRSAALTKGNLGRIFLIGVLTFLIAAAVAFIFQGPFWVASLVLGFKYPIMPMWLLAPMTISGGLGGAISSPLMVIALALLYYDTRVRKEGFDLQVLVASLDQSPSPSGPGTRTPSVDS
jgi:hypothetical protein